jgi:hypothetical protein
MRAWLNQELLFLGDLLALNAAVESRPPVGDGAPGRCQVRRGVGNGGTDGPERAGTVALLPAVEASSDLACLAMALAAMSLTTGILPERAPVRVAVVRRSPEDFQ